MRLSRRHGSVGQTFVKLDPNSRAVAGAGATSQSLSPTKTSPPTLCSETAWRTEQEGSRSRIRDHRISDACQTPERLWSDCRSSNALGSLKAFKDKITLSNESGNETEGEIGRRYLVMYHRTCEDLHGRFGIRIHVQTLSGYALQPINM